MNAVNIRYVNDSLYWKAGNLSGLASTANAVTEVNAHSSNKTGTSKNIPASSTIMTIAVVAAASTAMVDSGYQSCGFYPSFSQKGLCIISEADLSGIRSVTQPVNTQIQDRAKAILIESRNETFESGVVSGLSRKLKVFFLAHGPQAASALQEALKSNRWQEDIIAEVLKSIGNIDDSASKRARFSMLIEFLYDKSPRIRDAAALALSDMGDKGAISFLRAAAKYERFSSIKAEFLKVAGELEEV